MLCLQACEWERLSWVRGCLTETNKLYNRYILSEVRPSVQQFGLTPTHLSCLRLGLFLVFALFLWFCRRYVSPGGTFGLFAQAHKASPGTMSNSELKGSLILSIHPSFLPRLFSQNLKSPELSTFLIMDILIHGALLFGLRIKRCSPTNVGHRFM